MEAPSFTEWYGNWGAVVITVMLGSGFALTFLWPRQRREWRNAELLQAFLISLFTEMFGVPLTIYLWPTLPTLVLGPVLVVLYLRLAKREEQALEARFGPRYRLYQQRVPRFLPVGGG